jgi:maleate isomerase
MWQPDGWGWRARIGLLTPHADIGPEAEFQAMARKGSRSTRHAFPWESTHQVGRLTIPSPAMPRTLSPSHRGR